MAVKVKKKATRVAKKTAPKKATSNGSLTMAERHRLAKCKAPKDAKCPAVNGKDSAFMYQQGCRAEACRLANKNYYQGYRARKAAEKAAKTRKRKAAAKKRVAKKTPAKKTATKR